MFGGKSAYPTTVIIDADGVISFYRDGSLPEATLREEIQKALKK